MSDLAVMKLVHSEQQKIEPGVVSVGTGVLDIKISASFSGVIDGVRSSEVVSGVVTELEFSYSGVAGSQVCSELEPNAGIDLKFAFSSVAAGVEC